MLKTPKRRGYKKGGVRKKCEKGHASAEERDYFG